MKKLHFGLFWRILASGRILITLQGRGIYLLPMKTCRRPPFRVCGATTPCAAPALPERGVLARVVPQSVAQGSAFGLQGGGALKCGRSIKSCPRENIDIQVVSKVFLRETRRNLGSIGGFSALEKFLRSPGLGFERAKWRKWELKSWIFLENQ